MTAVELSKVLLGGNASRDQVLQGLIDRWTEPHRAYHALTHLEAALKGVELFDLTDTERAILEWALWFHDAIYDATAPDNEELSAVLAEIELVGLMSAHDIAEVARLVRLTAGHVADPGDALGAVMIDIDLSILGSESDAYRRYVNGVRIEYSHRGDEDFRAGRSAFLLGMLARAQIFNTTRGVELWEADARDNLATELAALQDFPEFPAFWALSVRNPGNLGESRGIGW